MDIATRIFQFIRRKFYSFDTREVFPCTLTVLKSWRSYIYCLASRFTIHWQTTRYLRTLMRMLWQRFSIRTLGEYYYIMTYIWKRILLADVFENFHDSYGLDPAYYYTFLGFTWDAMLKQTGVRFKLLTDIDMVKFIERGIRSSLSQCSNRYAQ